MQRYNAPKRNFLAFRQKLLAFFINPAQNASYLAGIGRFMEMATRPAAFRGRPGRIKYSQARGLEVKNDMVPHLIPSIIPCISSRSIIIRIDMNLIVFQAI